MALLEEISQMKASGATDSEIAQSLEEKGMNPKEINEAMSQSTIKDAVTLDSSQNQDEYQQPDLQPSMMEPPTEANEQQAVQSDQSDQYQEQYPQDQYQQYAQPPSPQQQYSQDYSSYSPSLSADTITEIADQVLTEKISALKEGIERIASFKTSSEAKLRALDERLQKIEKIIDRLQLSILQKVGENMTSIEDIKREMIESQKTFKALLPKSSQQSAQTQRSTSK